MLEEPTQACLTNKLDVINTIIQQQRIQQQRTLINYYLVAFPRALMYSTISMF